MSIKTHFIDKIALNSDGLVPVIAQQFDTKEVLMMAWMNLNALEKTLQSGELHYWSRSRQSLWHKGATSGCYQILKSLRFDCDQDTLLALVDQKGAACHLGKRSCFFRAIDNDKIIEVDV